MRTFKRVLIFAFVLALFIVPSVHFIHAAGLVPDCNIDATGQCVWGWNEFMALVNNVINFTFADLVVPIAAIMFAYAGILLLTAGEESSSARTKAKSIFMNALIGLIISALCWIIVNTILSTLGYDGAWLGFKLVVQ